MKRGGKASAAQAADWPRLSEAWGSLRHALALKEEASCWLKAEPACFPLGVGIALLALVFVGAGLFIDPIQTTSAGRGF